jgi:hypothetical protein
MQVSAQIARAPEVVKFIGLRLKVLLAPDRARCEHALQASNAEELMAMIIARI